MFVAACAVGPSLAGMTLQEVIGGFPRPAWPRARSACRRRGPVDAVLMAIAINTGICAGSFAPTSLFGVITYRIAQQAGIDVSTFALLAVAIAANVALLVVASIFFPTASDAEAKGTAP